MIAEGDKGKREEEKGENEAEQGSRHEVGDKK